MAVVDTGVDSRHPDLRKRVAEAWKIEPPAEPAQCRPGRNNDVFGHGTGVAGIIAGIAPNARIFDIRMLDARCAGSGAALLAGVRMAIDRGMRLINLSLACHAKFAAELRQLCDRACRRNIVIVAAKRNMPLEDNGWPAEISTCINVDRADFASPYLLKYHRPPIEFVARGTRVVTPARGGGYCEMTGTSFATPTVTGLCALLLGAFPRLRTFELKTLLKHFADQYAESASR